MICVLASPLNDTLDQSKAMNKKEKACDKDYITFYMKANNNFRATKNVINKKVYSCTIGQK
jgi:hypothetical protein